MDARKRRTFLALLAFGCIASPAFIRKVLAASSSTADNQDQSVRFRWEVPAAHFDAVNNNLRFQGKVKPETDTRGVPLGIFIFIGLVFLPDLARAVLALRRDIVHGGIIIDTRGEEIVITKKPELAAGDIVIVSREGTTFHERHEFSNSTELVKALAEALGKAR